MAWRPLDPWTKGWIVGFFLGVLHIIITIIIAINSTPDNALLISRILVYFTKLFSNCVDCTSRTYYVLFASPLIFAFIGAIIAFIVTGFNAYKKPKVFT